MMASYVFYGIKQHVLPIYVALGVAQFAKRRFILSSLRLSARVAGGLVVLSWLINSVKMHVGPLQPETPEGERSYAVVTGASSGIGKEIAFELAERGFNLVLVGRNESSLDSASTYILDKLAAAAEVKEEAPTNQKRSRRRNRKVAGVRQAQVDGITMVMMPCDVSNSTECSSLHTKVNSMDLNVSVLVNSAGVCWVDDLIETPTDTLEQIINTNVVGSTYLAALFGADMKKKGRGRLLFVSSISAAAPNPSVATYAATKAYISSFASALKAELEPFGVGVTCSAPGATRTAFSERSNAGSALTFTLPGFSMNATNVAEESVEAMLRADGLVVPGS
ncbi:unnamed protein product [Chrysoparadoxa australica]